MLLLKLSLHSSYGRVMVKTINKMLIFLYSSSILGFPRQLPEIKPEIVFLKEILTGAFHQNSVYS